MKCFGSIWFKRLKDKVKELLKDRKTDKLSNGSKRQVSNHYRDEQNAFKRKLEGKFETEDTEKVEIWQNSNYESTNIGSTYDSMYFRWTRVKEYYKEAEDIYLDKAINEAKIIMNS